MRSIEGSGIGLALVEELVRLHGGEVGASSRPGGGSDFTVRIPLGTAHLDPARRQAGAGDSSPASAARPYLDEALRWASEVSEGGGLALGDAEDEAPEAGATAGRRPSWWRTIPTFANIWSSLWAGSGP